jgi:uncharacterized protein (TIGR02145 family)
MVLGLILTSSCKKDEDSSGTVTDSEGNIYTTITIDSLIWMVENLKTTKYSDGTSIPLVTDNDEWKALTTPGYCWYENDIANKATYGALYNFHVVAPYLNGNKSICPTGWHVPSDNEWKELETFIGISDNEINIIGNRGDNQGGLLKEAGTSHWSSPNLGATNETGFTALPGGYRGAINDIYSDLGNQAVFSSSTEDNTRLTYHWGRGLSYDKSSIYRETPSKFTPISLRCIKN